MNRIILSVVFISLSLLLGCDKDRSLCLSKDNDASGKWKACKLSCLRKISDACTKQTELTSYYLKKYSTPPSNTRGGLRAHIQQIMVMEEQGKHGAAVALAKDLELPDPDSFFAGYFEPGMAKRLAEEYKKQPLKLYALPTALRVQQKEHRRTQVLTNKHASIDDQSSTLLQHLALSKAKRPLILYSFKLIEPKANDGFVLWSFVHDGQTFRYVGKMRTIEPYPPTDETQMATRELPMKQVEALLATNENVLNAEMKKTLEEVKKQTKADLKKALFDKKDPSKTPIPRKDVPKKTPEDKKP